MNQDLQLKHNPLATIRIYCGLALNFKGEPDNNAIANLCFEIVT